MEESHGVQVHWVKVHQMISSKKTNEVCGRVLANFGLHCLKRALKHKGLILTGDEHEQRDKSVALIKQDL